MQESWRALYEAAILETDGAKIQERITAAQLAIRARMEELAHGSASREEHIAITGALSGLQIFVAELRSGNWKKSNLRTNYDDRG